MQNSWNISNQRKNRKGRQNRKGITEKKNVGLPCREFPVVETTAKYDHDCKVIVNITQI